MNILLTGTIRHRRVLFKSSAASGHQHGRWRQTRAYAPKSVSFIEDEPPLARLGGTSTVTCGEMIDIAGVLIVRTR
jgi:hypothetical protein